MLFPGHITKPQGNALPGVVAEVLLAPKAWFTTIATPTASPAGILPSAVITGDHIFIGPDYGFIKVQLTGRSASVTFSRSGELDSRSVAGVFEGYTAHINEEVFRLMGWSFDGILLSKDNQCGDTDRYLQMGTSCTSAYDGDHEFTSGVEGGDGRKGTTLRFESIQAMPYIYTGAVTLATFPES